MINDEAKKVGVPQDEVDAGAIAVRKVLKEAGYSSFVSDEQCWALANSVLNAALKVRVIVPN